MIKREKETDKTQRNCTWCSHQSTYICVMTRIQEDNRRSREKLEARSLIIGRCSGNESGFHWCICTKICSVIDGFPHVARLLMFPLFLQGRHTKTGQLAAIKVMNVTEVSAATDEDEGPVHAKNPQHVFSEQLRK